MAIISIIAFFGSDLNFQDLSDDHHTADLHAQGYRNQVMAAWIRPHDAHVLRIKKCDHYRDEDRHPAQHPRRHPRTGCQCFQVAEDAEALTNRVGNLLEYLGEITASL